MKRKHTLGCFFALVAISRSLAAESELKSAPFVVGPSKFRGEDLIQITAVDSTTTQLGKGDAVRVTGHYRLSSREEATLSLFLTTRDPVAKSAISPLQTIRLSNGAGDFDLRCEVKEAGFLHLSFYPAKGGSAFGGVYFGTTNQMEQIKDWSLAHYDR